jgi:hypothetical protein
MALEVLDEEALVGNLVLDNIEDNVLILGVEMLVSKTIQAP